MNITVKRSAPGARCTFEAPADGTWTIMDVLDYIALHLDPSLAYYKHSACNQGICARCMLKVNGKTALACTCRPEGDDLSLEPRAGSVVRDLVVWP